MTKELVIYTYKILKSDILQFSSLKDLYHRSIQNGEVSKVRETPAIVGDNGGR